MKLSVKLDYAFRALACLARRYSGGEVCCIEEIAEIEEIPANYLVQILSELRNGGIVASKRGKQGGYLLARSPEEISMKDVIALSQGDLFQSVTGASGKSGARVASCWARLQESFEASAQSISLKELATAENEEMYYI
ncbi:Rrf2 family transcriptional regulator [Puniceicoccaceae bacterium K14]|nr:Rrf2 family transcriptional regulator [Puniceicoccaceae bacterium K14]